MSIPFAKLSRSVTGPPKTFRENLYGKRFYLSANTTATHPHTVLPNNCISVLNNSTNLPKPAQGNQSVPAGKIFGLYDHLLTSTYQIT
jgi:hypothetical protein